MFFGKISSRRAAAAAARAAAHVAPPKPVDLRELARRAVARDIVDYRTVLTIEGIGELDARLMDISPYGFQSRASARILERGARIRVLLPLLGNVEAEAMWGLKGIFGCKFVEPVDSDLYPELLALLRGASPDLPDAA